MSGLWGGRGSGRLKTGECMGAAEQNTHVTRAGWGSRPPVGASATGPGAAASPRRSSCIEPALPAPLPSRWHIAST